MPVSNSDCIKKFSTGVVYEIRVPIQEDFSIDNTGKRTITSDRTFITTQTASKVDVAATAAYAEVVAPFQIDSYPFYATSINLKRTDHVAGTRINREVGGTGMAPVARWACTVVFETRTSVSQERTEDSQKKTDEYPVITWSSNRFDMATTADVFGNSYQNTAGDFFAGISRPAEERVYSVSVNVPVRDPNNPSLDLVDVMTTNSDGDVVPKSAREIATELQVIEAGGLAFEPYYTNLYNYTNNSDVRIRGQVWPINTLRVGSMQVGEIQIDNSELYFQVQYTLIGRPWGWHREVANRGMNELEWTIPRLALYSGSLAATMTAAERKAYNEDMNKAYLVDLSVDTLTTILGRMTLSESNLKTIAVHVYGHGLPSVADDNFDVEATQFLMDKVCKPRRVPVTDAKGKLVPQPVFLDGYGQAQKSTGITAGALGDITVFAGQRLASCSFNVYEYLGARLDVGLNFPLFIPNSAEMLRDTMHALLYTNADAEYEDRISNTLPLVRLTGSVKENTYSSGNSYPNYGRSFWTPKSNGQLDVSISPGITMNFQDYYGADLTALPGVYSV